MNRRAPEVGDVALWPGHVLGRVERVTGRVVALKFRGELHEAPREAVRVVHVDRAREERRMER